MIPSINGRAVFQALTKARRRSDGPVSLRFTDGGTGRARVSYAIGRWVGRAVVRNRVRRRLRAAVARHEDMLVTGGYYLFSAAAAAEHVPFTELDGAVTRLLGRVREARR